MKLLTAIILIFLALACSAQQPGPADVTVSTSKELAEAVKDLPWTGGRISLKPGEYEIGDTLLFEGTCFLTIEGAGASTVVRKKGPGDLMLFRGNCWHNTITGLTLEGDPSAVSGSGIVFVSDKEGAHCGDTLIRECRIRGFAESGVRFEGESRNPQSSNKILWCYFQNNRGHQLYMRCSNDYHVTGTQFGGSPEVLPSAGCYMENSSAGTYSMNYHWDNAKGLVLGTECNFNRIENNRFEESAFCGLQIGDENGRCGYNIVTGNTIHTNSKNNYGAYDQVAAFNANNVTFADNQIFSWNHLQTASRNALFVSEGCKEWIIKDNIFRHFTERPLVYDKNGKHIIKDNITGEKVER